MATDSTLAPDGKDVEHLEKSGVATQKQPPRGCCRQKLTANAKSLIIAAVLVAVITSVQFVFAVATGSIALMADCISMAIDFTCYIAALIAEVVPMSFTTRRRFELTVSFVSLGILIGLSLYFVSQAAQGVADVVRIQHVRQLVDAPPGSSEPYGRDVLAEATAMISARHRALLTDPSAETTSSEMQTFAMVRQKLVDSWAKDVTSLLDQSSERTSDGEVVRMVRAPYRYNGISSSMYWGIMPLNVTHQDAGCPTVPNGDKCDMDDPPDGWVMLGFGLFGITVDLITLSYYLLFAGKTFAEIRVWCCGSAPATLDITPVGKTEDIPAPTENSESSCNTQIAMMHVGADFLRSTATVVAGAYILARPGWPSAGADDIGGLFVSCCIVLGSLYGLNEWYLDLKGYLQGTDKSQPEGETLMHVASVSKPSDEFARKVGLAQSNDTYASPNCSAYAPIGSTASTVTGGTL